MQRGTFVAITVQVPPPPELAPSPCHPPGPPGGHRYGSSRKRKGGQRLPALPPRVRPLALRSHHCAGAKILHRNVQRFRGGLVFKALRLCVSLNSRLESNKEREVPKSVRQIVHTNYSVRTRDFGIGALLTKVHGIEAKWLQNHLQGYLAHKKLPPPRATVGP